jgi:hypothetical protein
MPVWNVVNSAPGNPVIFPSERLPLYASLKRDAIHKLPMKSIKLTIEIYRTTNGNHSRFLLGRRERNTSR